MAALVLAVHDWWRGGADRREALPRVVLPVACICLALLVTAIAWSTVRRSSGAVGNSSTVNVAAVQGNVPRLGLEFNAQRRAVLDYHVRETLQLADDVAAGRAPQPQFVIWPENSSDIDPIQNADAAQQISVAARAVGVPILVGTCWRDPTGRRRTRHRRTR